ATIPARPKTQPGQVPGAATLPPLPTGAKEPTGEGAEGVAPTPKPTKKKPVKLDPALLEKALMNRFSPQP
ncbi:hypothetical protein ACYOEI_18670, partial [Singulisphaera rosea]